jgi:hypothetical protein
VKYTNPFPQRFRRVAVVSAIAVLATACGGGGGSDDDDDNQDPTISLARAGTGSLVVNTAEALTATAADADGSVAKVEFFVDGTKVGEDTTAPFEFSWTPTAVGSYELTAVVTDDEGATATSTAVTISVTTAANALPTVTLADPVVSGTAPATVTLTATASDSDGTIASVEFFNGATSLGAGTLKTGTTDTWELVLNNQPAGTLSVTAKATDNGGGETVTAAKTATVNDPANNVPTVTLAAVGATGTVGVAINLSATATDSDGTISGVEFFNGATSLGAGARVGSTNEWTLAYTPTAAGTLSITAKATDDDGAVTESSPAQSVTVSPNPVGSWASQSTAQKAGITEVPSLALDAGNVAQYAMAGLAGAAGPAAANDHAALMFGMNVPAVVTAGTCGANPVNVAPGTPDRIDFTTCEYGGYTFTDATPAPVFGPDYLEYTAGATATVVFNNIAVTGNGAPGPLSGLTVSCTGTPSADTCLVSEDNGNKWGTGLSWTYTGATNYVLGGVLHAAGGGGPGLQANVRYDGFNPLTPGGRAIIYGGADSYAVATPVSSSGATQVTLSVSINGSAASTVSCTQGGGGAWTCVP